MKAAALILPQRRMPHADTGHAGPVLWCRMPGLLSCAARAGIPGVVGMDPSLAPVAVSEGRRLIDLDPVVSCLGIPAGESVTRVRRIMPALIVVPRHEIDERRVASLSHRLYDTLCGIAPIIEPAGPDTAFAAGALHGDRKRLCDALAVSFPGLSPVTGAGVSKLASRAIGESACLLRDASVEWLWPEDAAIVGRLQRLGLATFGDVAALPESALAAQFGPKTASLLIRRSRGEDNDPVRPLWPMTDVSLARRFDLEPIADIACLERELLQMATQASGELYTLGRHGRLVRLAIITERHRGAEATTCEWRPPWPIQSLSEIVGCIRRLRSQVTIDAAVVALSLTVAELDLPSARSLSLFDEASPLANVTSKRRLATTKRLLTIRYGKKALRTLSELPVSTRDRRRELARAAGALR